MSKKKNPDKVEQSPITGFEVAYYTAGKEVPFYRTRGYEIMRQRSYEKQRQGLEDKED